MAGSTSGGIMQSSIVSAGNGFLQSLGTSGYTLLPNGIYLQWITANAATGAGTATNWPITFPNNCYSAIANSTSANTSIQITKTTSQVTLISAAGTPSCFVIAVGN